MTKTIKQYQGFTCFSYFINPNSSPFSKCNNPGHAFLRTLRDQTHLSSHSIAKQAIVDLCLKLVLVFNKHYLTGVSVNDMKHMKHGRILIWGVLNISILHRLCYSKLYGSQIYSNTEGWSSVIYPIPYIVSVWYISVSFDHILLVVRNAIKVFEAKCEIRWDVGRKNPFSRFPFHNFRIQVKNCAIFLF